MVRGGGCRGAAGSARCTPASSSLHPCTLTAVPGLHQTPAPAPPPAPRRYVRRREALLLPLLLVAVAGRRLAGLPGCSPDPGGGHLPWAATMAAAEVVVLLPLAFKVGQPASASLPACLPARDRLTPRLPAAPLRRSGSASSCRCSS